MGKGRKKSSTSSRGRKMGTQQNCGKVENLLPDFEKVLKFYIILSISYILVQDGTNIAKDQTKNK
jgi:hypothetical protein